MQTEAQKRAKAKYEAKQREQRIYSLLAARVKTETADRFKERCAANGTNPNAVLTEFILNYIGE